MGRRPLNPMFIGIAIFAVLAGLACSGKVRIQKRSSGSSSSGLDQTAEDRELSLCLTENNELPAQRVRRLSSREYTATLKSLFGSSVPNLSHLNDEESPSGYDNGPVGFTVQANLLSTYQQTAETIAEKVVTSDLKTVLGTCDPAKQGETACLDVFLDGFAKRVYRRPLTSEEKGGLRIVFNEGKKIGGFKVGLQTVLEAVLLSPTFIYREEVGKAGGEKAILSDFEVATQLAFLVTGATPDAELLAAAEAGKLQTKAGLTAEIERLLQTNNAKTTLREFLAQWTGTNRVREVAKNPKIFPDFNDSVRQSMIQEANLFFDHILWSTPGTLYDLFTSDVGFVDKSLAKIYGLQSEGSGFEQVSLAEPERKGILTRAVFLAAHSSADHSGPIERGVFVRDSFLCLPTPPPPADVADVENNDEKKPTTTRERFAQHSKDAACIGCHKGIDGVGFGLEDFDGIGAYRTMENGKPIDARGLLVGASETETPFTGGSELSGKLAESKRLGQCFLVHTYRFAMGEVEKNASGCVMKHLASDFSNSETKITDVIIKILESPIVRERSVKP